MKKLRLVRETLTSLDASHVLTQVNGGTVKDGITLDDCAGTNKTKTQNADVCVPPTAIPRVSCYDTCGCYTNTCPPPPRTLVADCTIRCVKPTTIIAPHTYMAGCPSPW